MLGVLQGGIRGKEVLLGMHTSRRSCPRENLRKQGVSKEGLEQPNCGSCMVKPALPQPAGTRLVSLGSTCCREALAFLLNGMENETELMRVAQGHRNCPCHTWDSNSALSAFQKDNSCRLPSGKSYF